MTVSATAQKPAETLPEWDLSALYQGMDDPAIEADLDRSDRDAKAFRERYQGGLALLGGAALGQAISEFEAMTDRLGRIMSYAQLMFAARVGDEAVAQFSQTMHERVTAITSQTLFFTLELNKLSGNVLTEQLKDPACEHYAPWIREVRAFRKHQLSDELEEFLHEKSVTGRAAWVRLFEETLSSLRFDIDGEEMPIADVLDRLSDSDGAVRKAAAKALGKGLSERVQLFSLVTNTLAKDKEIEDVKRAYPRSISERNLANQVEDDVVDALVTSVRAAYPRLSHRYYAIKARWFGVDQLDYWDRNAPLPDDDNTRYSWNEARNMVLGAYGDFAAEMETTAKRFFDERWIDAALRPDKDSGAFSHPTVPSAHPFILMNYHGRARDVMTLAHELGHGVHQVLSAGQGALMADTPLTTAETASVFGEMLTFQAMLKAEQDPARRRILLAGKVEDMLNTVVRQIAFHTFEERVHAARRTGELTPAQLGDIWMDVQGESLGPAIRFDDDYRTYWAYIPHFVHTPFYVYAYAFGDCLVNSLYDVFAGGHAGFQAKYLDMLAAGGTLRHRALLSPFGLDASDPEFWNRGLAVIGRLIDQLEALE